MKNSTISLPIQIKFISTKKENLHLSVSIYSKISDLKYLIFIEDEDHPTPEMQKLIISGRIPADYEMIENFLQDDYDGTSPLIFHLVVSPQPSQTPLYNQGFTTAKLTIQQRFEHPKGLVFDDVSLDAAKKWLESTRFEDAGANYINTRSTVVIADMIKSSFGDLNSQTTPSTPVQPENDAQALPMPRFLNFSALFKTLFAIFMTRDLLPSIYWSVILGLIYYIYLSGLLEYLLKRFYPSLFQRVPGQPNQSLFQTITELAHIPRSQGAVVDLYSFLSAFIFSLYPGWQAA